MNYYELPGITRNRISDHARLGELSRPQSPGAPKDEHLGISGNSWRFLMISRASLRIPEHILQVESYVDS